MDDRQAPQDNDGIAIAVKGSGHAPQDLPRVVASGRGAVAEQILEIAFAEGVKVRTDADLAEILSAVDVDSEIPLAALATVAEILSYVYRAQGAAAPDPTQAVDREEQTLSGANEEPHVER